MSKDKTFEVSSHIIEQAHDGLRLAANFLDSRKRETAADRQIEYAERLLQWVIDGQIGQQPSWFPNEKVVCNSDCIEKCSHPDGCYFKDEKR